MKERIKRVCIVYFIIFTVLAAYAVITEITGAGIPCIFRTVTGLNCPGCGISRAAHAVLRFRFAQALSYNYMLPFEAAYVCYAAVYVTADYLKNGIFRLMIKPEVLNIIMLTGLIVWGIVRNILGI